MTQIGQSGNARNSSNQEDPTVFSTSNVDAVLPIGSDGGSRVMFFVAIAVDRHMNIYIFSKNGSLASNRMKKKKLCHISRLDSPG